MSFFKRSTVFALALMLISSTSFANLKKGKIPSGSTRQFEFIPATDGPGLLSLIYDAASTDLDLAVGLEDGTLIAASISPESFFESLQVGLVGDVRYVLVVDSFEGPTTPFRLIANSGQQETITTAVGQPSLREVEMSAAGTKLRDSLRKISKSNK
jgi:hypothetical protein